MKFVKLNNLSLKNQICTPLGKISFCGKDSIPLKHNFFSLRPHGDFSDIISTIRNRMYDFEIF